MEIAIEDEYIVYLKHRPVKNAFGLVDHWYYDVPKMDLEVHMGAYLQGTHLKSGTTKESHTYSEIKMCRECVDKLLKDTVELTQVFYYPIINCETLASIKFCEFGVSVQALFITAITISFFISLVNIKFVIFMLIFIILYLIYSKYTYSKTYNQECVHLEKKEKL